MRWKNVVAGLALAAAGGAGCKQQCFLNECDYHHYANLGMPSRLDTDAAASMQPIGYDVPTPSTVLDPEREPRHLTLAEAIAIALEQGGSVGSANNPGFANNTLVSAGPQARTFLSGGIDSIRVLALDPAITGTDMEASLAKFDARWTSSMTWNTTDRPVGTVLDTFQAFGRQNAINTIDAAFNTSLVKPLPTGGVAGITFRTDYQLSNLNPRINPSYRPVLQFGFEQPLLQGFGVEINQLRASHPGVTPGSVLPGFAPGGRVEGILITRIRFDIQRAEFERNVNLLLLNVETAYWNLYGAYWTLYSRESALRQAYEAWKINKARYEAGRIAITEFAQTRVQYELFRSQRIDALARVLDRERQLRGFLGLPIEDGKRLIPVDAPALAPYQPDWEQAKSETLALRPELVMARHELKARQLEIVNQKNQLLPDVRFFSNYDINSVGSRLDGPGPSNAFSNLASGNFNNWGMGVRAEMPLGYRDAHAALRFARLNLARSYLALQDQERRAVDSLGLSYRQLFEFNEQIKALRARREAAAQQLEARFREFIAGRGTLDILLEAQRFWADALDQEYANIVNYNNALALWEFAKGTLLQHDNVVISEGPLPGCAQVRAVEHERERTKALVLRERANPIVTCGGTENGCAPLPALPGNAAPSIPAVLEGQKMVPALPDNLPPGPDALHLRGSLPTTLSPAMRPLPPGPDTGSSGKAPVPPPAKAPEVLLESPKLVPATRSNRDKSADGPTFNVPNWGNPLRFQP